MMARDLVAEAVAVTCLGGNAAPLDVRCWIRISQA